MISFILVNYNARDLTAQAIHSIEKAMQKQNFEIILVDNASTDGSMEHFNGMKKNNFFYIYNNENVGFGRANNIGFNKVQGDYVYIINNDTILHTSDIEIIVEQKFTNNDNLGVLATKVQYVDGSPQPNVQKFSSVKAIFLGLLKMGQFVRNSRILLYIAKLFPFKPAIVRAYLENFNTERPEQFIDWTSGCSLIIKKEIYRKLGGFDENFFMYSEDEELCYRVHKAGFKVMYTPDILITHYEGRSNTSKSINEFLIRERVKSHFYYFRKHFPDDYQKLMRAYRLAGVLGYLFSARLRIIFRTLRSIPA